MNFNVLLILSLLLFSSSILSQKTSEEYYNATERAYAFYENEEYSLGIAELEILSLKYPLQPNDRKGLIYGYSMNYEFEQAFELIKSLCKDSISFNKNKYAHQFYQIIEVEGWDEFVECRFKKEIGLDTSYYHQLIEEIDSVRSESRDTLFHYYLEAEKHAALTSYYDSILKTYVEKIDNWLNKTEYSEIKKTQFFATINMKVGADVRWFLPKHKNLFEKAFEDGTLSSYDFLFLHRSGYVYDFGLRSSLKQETPSE